MEQFSKKEGKTKVNMRYKKITLRENHKKKGEEIKMKKSTTRQLTHGKQERSTKITVCPDKDPN